METAHWIAADWGTSNLRIWAMGAAGEPFHHRSSENGMGTLERAEFEPALLALVGDLLPKDTVTPVICCGMVGARQGWHEAPYMSLPCLTPEPSACAVAPTSDPRLDVRILPGVKQDNPADVMRGEETQILGFLRLEPGFEGILCLPGTHTKWVEIAGGKIRSFRTCMTGEVFALLSKSSVLRHSVSGAGWDGTEFDRAVRKATATAHGEAPALLDSLFSIRAADLLHGAPPAAARARLSGLLIGAEIAGLRSMLDGRSTALLGTQALSDLYRTALSFAGRPAQAVDADAMTLSGLTAAFASLKETCSWTAP